MKVITKISDLRAELSESIRKGWDIGFVPTMGFLHEGHLEIVRKSCRENIITVVSIFVNPTQFGPNEDFDQYPRDQQRDETLLREERVDYLFCPGVEEIYPDGACTKVTVPCLTDVLCGVWRPGHFEGVATVVLKLLAIVRPKTAYFGLKDYQQYLVVSRMARDLNLYCGIKGVPTVRENDGLAMSSRNVYLQPEEREAALSLYRSFSVVQKMLDEGANAAEIADEVRKFISSYGNIVEYAELVDPETLQPAKSVEAAFLCILAAKVGNVRLIDNMLFRGNRVLAYGC